jgi:hypothetical protein
MSGNSAGDASVHILLRTRLMAALKRNSRMRRQPAPLLPVTGGRKPTAAAAAKSTTTAAKQRAEKRPRCFEFGPADHKGKPYPSNSTALTTPVRC